MQPIIAVAGATGDLGHRIVEALVARGATVRALLRPGTPEEAQAKLRAAGARLAIATPMNVIEMTQALLGVQCVVSALNGLRDVIIDRQTVLLNAAVQAKVPRFIPSDYSEEFRHVEQGSNRNLELRQEFMLTASAAPIAVTSVLNGAFMDMLGAEMPIIQPAIKRVLYWKSNEQALDFTTKDDVAAYVAAVATDAEPTPRWLRIAGETTSAAGLAATMTAVTGDKYKTLWAGNMTTLGAMIKIAKLVAPQPDEAFPPYQGMQYMRDMFSGKGKLQKLDNDRYPKLAWSRTAEVLRENKVGT